MSDLLGFEPTNTFNSVSFDVLKMDGVEDPLIDVNRLATMDINECYFETTVKFIIESNKQFAESKIKLYHSISEATSYGVIHESFSDFFDKVKEIIKKFLDFLKSLFQRFLTNLAKFVDSESYLKKHKKDFQNFRPADKFEIDGYKYTFNDNIPDPDAILTFSQDFLGNFGESDPDGGGSNIPGYLFAKNVIDKMKTDLNLDDKYCEYRAEVLGKQKTDKIYQNDYSDELFKIFRDGEMTTDTIEVDYAYLRMAVDRFFDYKKIKNNVDKQYKKVEKDYKELEKQIKEITSGKDLTYGNIMDRLPDGYNNLYYDNNGARTLINKTTDAAVNKDIISSLDSYVKTKVEEVQECSNIHALAFSAKLDALKECNRQDRNTLYLALSRIQRTQPKRERDENKI